MKLFDRSTEVEYIDIVYKNGKRYSIWLPKEVDLALKLVVDEDEEVEEYEEGGLLCVFDLHGQALWNNINTIEESN